LPALSDLSFNLQKEVAAGEELQKEWYAPLYLVPNYHPEFGTD